MAFGQLLALPVSSSFFDDPSWRASISPLIWISGTAMGEAATKAARRETVKYFMAMAVVGLR
jgi:hypothetical protein|tara:strand:+ start:12783 stop:12968 length:186 start_codon:yes stop_codon:yes gene_type:complete